ncbi:hypothetical protein [Pantoea endophytica]|uniref:hypothetical protein n=1 Tax=Pantoea endophytica TaxID=92488 RepID=UPI001AE613EA|nr:hypothetical protein [Pantoea endophytica]
MKYFQFSLFSFCCLTTYSVFGQEWKNECVGYYKMELPSGLETALYVVDNLTAPPKEPKSLYGVLIQRTREPVITFGTKARESGDDRVQAQFSELYYGEYKIGVSSESSNTINFSEYKKRLKATLSLRLFPEDN